MKRLIIVIIFMFITNMLLAPKVETIMIFYAPKINYYDPLIKAITWVESKHGLYLYNPEEEATGWFQIRPIRLQDYNTRTGKMYTMNDMYNYDISKEIFLYYTKGRSYEKVAKSWNGSGPKTKIYWNKIKKEL